MFKSLYISIIFFLCLSKGYCDLKPVVSLEDKDRFSEFDDFEENVDVGLYFGYTETLKKQKSNIFLNYLVPLYNELNYLNNEDETLFLTEKYLNGLSKRREEGDGEINGTLFSSVSVFLHFAYDLNLRFISFSLSLPEKILYQTNPENLRRSIYLGYLADKETKKFFPDNEKSLGNGDAFRHAFWSALMTKYMGHQNAIVWGTLHEVSLNEEKNDYLFDKSIEMDLRNNFIGRSIALKNSNSTDEELVNIILLNISQGKLVKLMIGTNQRIIQTTRN